MQSDRLNLVMSLSTANHIASFHLSKVTLMYNLFMTSARFKSTKLLSLTLHFRYTKSISRILNCEINQTLSLTLIVASM